MKTFGDGRATSRVPEEPSSEVGDQTLQGWDPEDICIR